MITSTNTLPVSKKEEISFLDRTFSLEYYVVPDLHGLEGGYAVELWEGEDGSAILHYAADFLNEQNAQENFDYVKSNIGDFID